MLTLITAALAAAQPAPANMHVPEAQSAQHAEHGQMQMPMQPQQHQALKDGCPCCSKMGQGNDHQQTLGERPSRR